MTKDKVRLRSAELGTALERLKEILAVPTDHIGRLDALIQRFEFCYELSWKALRAALELYGHDAPSPRQCFQKAYAMGWLDDETLWLRMMTDRNMTVHTYREDRAQDIATRIPEYRAALCKLCDRLSSLAAEQS